jgi:hypothetical protein
LSLSIAKRKRLLWPVRSTTREALLESLAWKNHCLSSLEVRIWRHNALGQKVYSFHWLASRFALISHIKSTKSATVGRAGLSHTFVMSHRFGAN